MWMQKCILFEILAILGQIIWFCRCLTSLEGLFDVAWFLLINCVEVILVLSSFSYYPLLPPFRKEDHQQQATKKEEEEDELWEEPTEVNLDLVHAFESQYAVLPVRPDILLLPSDLKPFAKVSQDKGFVWDKKKKKKKSERLSVTRNQTQDPWPDLPMVDLITELYYQLSRSSVENCEGLVWLQWLVALPFLCICLIRNIKQILLFQLGEHTLKLSAKKIRCGQDDILFAECVECNQ